MKKIVYIILVICFVLINIPAFAVEGENEAALKDIDKHWAKAKIIELVNIGATAGYPNKTFRPDNNISWGETITFLVKALGYPTDYKTDTFKLGNHWTRPFIETAVQHGILISSEHKSFKPDAYIKREDMAKVICRALKLEPKKSMSSPYKDIEDFYANRLYLDYLMRGYVKDGQRYFGAGKPLTRAEAAVLIINTRNCFNDRDSYIESQKKLTMEDKNFVKAVPDSEFEKFINSEEGKKYASIRYFRAENGVIIFKDGGKWGNYGEAVLDNTLYKDINKVAYNCIKDAVMYAKKYDKYVRAFYNASADCVIIDYYPNQLVGEKENQNGRYSVTLYLRPRKEYDEARKDAYYPPREQFQKKYAYVAWSIGGLYDRADIYGYPIDNKYIIDSYGLALKSLFLNVYGQKDGTAMYNYAINEHMTERKQGDKRTNKSIVYINGIEVANYNDEGARIDFQTSVKQ